MPQILSPDTRNEFDDVIINYLQQIRKGPSSVSYGPSRKRRTKLNVTSEKTVGEDEFEIISNVNDDLEHDEIILYTAVHHENELRSASQTNQGDFVLIKQSGR